MRNFFLLIVYCTISVTSTSQLLYRCASPQGDTVTYVFGTMHEIPKDNFRYDPVLDSILAKTEIYFSEQLIWDTTTIFQKIAAVPKSTDYYPRGQTLKDSVTPMQLQQLQQFYKKWFNIPAKKFNAELGRSPYMIHFNFIRYAPGFVFPDRIILDKAVALKKPIIQVDRTETFVNSLKYLQHYWTVDSLTSLPRRYNEVLRYDSIFLALYQQQDTAGMKRVMETTYRNVAGYYDNVIRLRNTEWEKAILTKEKKINFFVCGMSHVIANGGLVDFFRSRNYTITVIPIRLTKN